MGAKQASNRGSAPETLGKTRMKAGGNGLSLRHPEPPNQDTWRQAGCQEI
jgi:hypothetical protein